MLTYIDNFFYSANLPICKADFDAMRMCRRICENVFDNALSKFASALVLFQYDHHGDAGFDVCAKLSIHPVCTMAVIHGRTS